MPEVDNEPWGALQGGWTGGTPPPDSVRLRFQGLIFEADSTQLYYARARWYDPLTKRFMSPDPLGISAGMNPYLFAGGDPGNARDASGLLVGDNRVQCYSLLRACSGPDLSSFFASMLDWQEGGGGRGVWLGCRSLAGLGALVGSHCAILVRHEGRTYFAELLNKDGTKAIVFVQVHQLSAKYLAHYSWVATRYADPATMLRSIAQKHAEHFGSAYSAAGQTNSNRWVWEVYEAAGAAPRGSDVRKVNKEMLIPGICGGAHWDPFARGYRCSR